MNRAIFLDRDGTTIRAMKWLNAFAEVFLAHSAKFRPGRIQG
jgi:hypothetical protein